jgi:hypothetical protein
VQRQARRVQARNANEEVVQPLLAELPARRREAIIRALTDLHYLLRDDDNHARPARDSVRESIACSRLNHPGGHEPKRAELAASARRPA